MVITLQYCQLLPLAFLRFAFCRLKCYCSDQYLLSICHLFHTNLFLRVICTNSQNEKQWFRTAFFVYSLIFNVSAWGAQGRV